MVGDNLAPGRLACPPDDGGLDFPVLSRRSLAETEALLEKSWFDTNTPDGKVFAKLVAGDTEGLLPLDEAGNSVRGHRARRRAASHKSCPDHSRSNRIQQHASRHW